MMHRPSRHLTIFAVAFIFSALSATAQDSAPTAQAPRFVAPKGTGSITGRVVFENGQPAVGIGVMAMMQNHAFLNSIMPYIGFSIDKQGHKIYGQNGPLSESTIKLSCVSTVTNADGTYRISGVTTAAYNVFVTSPHQPRWAQLDKPQDWAAAADEGVAAQEGQSVPAPDLVLTQGAILQGHVVEAATGRPLPGIVVKTHGPERPQSSLQTLTTVTDKTGRYTFRVAPGVNDLVLGGVRLAPGDEHDSAMKIDNALWWMNNHFTVVVDGGTPQMKNSLVETVVVKTGVGETHQIVFRVRRGTLQYRLDAAGNRQNHR